ncbi:MAG: hypothetical protein ACRD1T_16375, partial [Acidimicrobiia bacterium]
MPKLEVAAFLVVSSCFAGGSLLSGVRTPSIKETEENPELWIRATAKILLEEVSRDGSIVVLE